MPFIPHTETDIKAMLEAIGVSSIEDLFDEIPKELRADRLTKVPVGVSEMEIARTMRERAGRDEGRRYFIGAGAYEHHIPAAVWELTTRGEFYSAYTPYQAEASQGTLQLIYEYQSMMAGLMGLEVSNASLYDGATALAESVLMAVRANRRSKNRRIYMPRTVHPRYRQVVEAIVRNQGIELVALDYDRSSGQTAFDALPTEPGDFAALVIPQPNFFGMLEEVDALTDWAHQHGGMVVGVVNPTAAAALAPPGEWGSAGADIACGEGQPLGIPLSSGGPYFGFMCCKKDHVRQMPGRIVGRTVDMEGREGFALTLQAREQHIRRSKATSNICTNQGLMVTAATMYMALLGPDGLQRVAAVSHANTRELVNKLTAIDGVEAAFNGPFFHEAVVRLNRPAGEVIGKLLERDIVGGFALARDYPELEDGLLVCATETKLDADLEAYAEALRQILAA